MSKKGSKHFEATRSRVEKLGKKAEKAKAKRAATPKKQGLCPACGRRIELPNGRGRCECGQAVVARFGKLVRIKETPAGCLKELLAATTLEQPKAPEPQAKPKRERADGKMSGLDAAAKVLAEANEPLDTKTMVERMLAQGLWATGGKTPAATIYSAILREVAKGEASRFRKAERGKFELAK